MKKWVVAIVSLAGAATARAGAFDFKDAEGFEKCMQLDHLIETTNTAGGAEHRILTPEEIQPRCVAAAAALVTKNKDKDLGFECVKITKREAAPETSLDLIGATINISLPLCNEMAIYEVLMRPLSDGYETDWGKKKAKPIIKRCLKDNEFKKDFLEEKDSGDAARAANACQILLEEKLVKACKGGK